MFLIFSLSLSGCKKGDSHPTDPIDPVIPNSAPGSFTISLESVSSDTAKIIWTKAIDPENDSISYKVYLNDTLKAQNHSTLHFTFKNLQPQRSYIAKVVAVDSKSNETVSARNFTTTSTYWLKFLQKVEYGPITGYSYQKTGQMTRANDGGYIIVGTSQLGDWPDGPINTFTLKIDSLGNQIWQKRYSQIGDQFENKIISCGNGYLITGSLKVIKIDNFGNILWQILPTLPSETFNGIAVSSDGSIYTAGFAADSPPNITMATLKKYGPNGKLVWTRPTSAGGGERGR